jgi:hypothetical protein
MLLGTLLASVISASAEERGNPVVTAIGGTTIGGSLDMTITIGGRNKPLSATQIRALWRALILWFIFHVRS